MRRAAGVAALFIVAGCGEVPSALISVQFDEAQRIDQLRLDGQAGTRALFSGALRPPSAGGPLASPQTVRVLVDESLGGQSFHLEVAGLRGGVEVASG